MKIALVEPKSFWQYFSKSKQLKDSKKKWFIHVIIKDCCILLMTTKSLVNCCYS